jgi:hypothetical protein
MPVIMPELKIINPPLNKTIYLNSRGRPYPEVIQKAIRDRPPLQCLYEGCPICRDIPGRSPLIWRCDAKPPKKKRKSNTVHIKLRPGLKVEFH